MQPDPKVIAELVQRVVEAIHPKRILLFGSAARREMGPNSDLDVLVIMQMAFTDGRRRRKYTAIYGDWASPKTSLL
ncbi:MAG: nucleotidyltransferase domain-containing protein [Candidatus Poribacteria bacterium]|nr:nucleotidyltransferase domain-containing protein [Candidatus Poribacteria bacterium]